MLQPNRRKFRKEQKGRNTGVATRGAAVSFGEFGLKATERGRLTALDRETARTLAAIPPDRRRLVTGHESLGYFARRYGLEVVGAVIPGLSSQGGVSADALARLKQRIEAAGVDVVFAEAGTPRQVAEAIASETGARVVELAVETMPPDGRYATYMHQLAGTVASALAPRP